MTLVYTVTLVSPVEMAVQVPPVSLETKDHPDLRVSVENMEQPVFPELPVSEVKWEPPGQMVPMDNRVPPESQVQ